MYPIRRRLRRTVCSAFCAALAASVGGAVAARADLGPTVTTDRACYVVGQTVQLSGSGFAPYRSYVVSIDGVYLGSSTTDGLGNLSVPLHPGGLPAGTAQHYEFLQVTDGTTTAQTNFTVSRRAGVAILNPRGGAASILTGRFLVWGFSLSGISRPGYLHYLAPSGKLRKTVWLGLIQGPCGYLRTSVRRIFPFSVSPGTWTLQADTQQAYSRSPVGPMVRIRVVVR